jgi:3'(2'), 5'-bisphosphate nucleotidase
MPNESDWKKIDIDEVIDIALEAGKAIMEIYKKDFDVEYKQDESPLTEADRVAHRIISEGLAHLKSTGSEFPILSEEGKEILYEERKSWRTYWCVDPIDGTKEFIKKNGEFTVNIALIHDGEPVLGVVYAPAIEEMYWAKKGKGAYKGRVPSSEFCVQNIEKLPVTSDMQNGSDFRIVASKSHLNEETKRFVEEITRNTQHVTRISKGSSLKLLMIAEGSADLYPRLAPTMEWDTAAADAIVREAGKKVCIWQNSSTLKSPEFPHGISDLLAKELPLLEYNKADLLNPFFIVL